MSIYAHCWFLGWLELDLSLLYVFLNVYVEDSALTSIMSGGIVELVVFLLLQFFSQRGHMISR